MKGYDNMNTFKMNKENKISRKEWREVEKFIRFIKEILYRYRIENPLIEERYDELDSNGQFHFRKNLKMHWNELNMHCKILQGVRSSGFTKLEIRDMIFDTLESYASLEKYITSYYIDVKEIEKDIEYTRDENIVELKEPKNQWYDSQLFKRFDKAMQIMYRLSYYNPKVIQTLKMSPYAPTFKAYKAYYDRTMKLITLFDLNLNLVNRRLYRLNSTNRKYFREAVGLC